MQTVIEFIAGLVALFAAAALAHLGVDLERRPAPASQEREIHRVSHCGEAAGGPAGRAEAHAGADQAAPAACE